MTKYFDFVPIQSINSIYLEKQGEIRLEPMQFTIQITNLDTEHEL